MCKSFVLQFLGKSGKINNNMLRKHKCLTIEQLYCWYHEINIEEQEFKFLSFTQGYSKYKFKSIKKSIKNSLDIIKYEYLVVDSIGRVNSNLVGHLNFSIEKIFNILKGGVSWCPGCMKKCTFLNFKKGYSNNCGKNSCIAVYTNIVQKGKLSKIGKYKPEWSHWFNKTAEEKEECLRIRAIKTRATREGNNTYRKLSEIGDCEIYFKAASFKHGFKTSVIDEIKLLKDNGVFNKSSNTKGCVRDHLLSRRYGFDNNIPTWIISHPANCEIVLHAENVRRAFTNDNQITLDELLERIENWQ